MSARAAPARMGMVARVGTTCGARDVTCDDLHARRREYIVAPTSALSRQLREIVGNSRDLPLVYLLINVLSTVPAMGLMLLKSVPSHALGLTYFACVHGLYLQRFTSALRHSTRSPAFRRDSMVGRAMNAVAPMLLAPLLGIISGSHASLDTMMHGGENGTSPAARYQRDSLVAFVGFWMRFTFGSLVELPLYVIEKKRYGAAVQYVLGTLTARAVFMYAASINAVAAFWIFIVPYFTTSFVLAFGAWSQHIFIDPDKPKCHYRSSYCVINHVDNQLTFNDGYHTVYHADTKLHWSEFPERFVASLDVFAKNDGLIFDGVGVFGIGIAVMCGRLDWLADRYVYVGQRARTKADIVELLRRRLRPALANKKQQ